MNQYWNKWKSLLGSFHVILTILITLGYLLTTHLSTIESLKAAIAKKADSSELEQIDKKLTRIEVKLEEALLTKTEIENWRRQLNQMVIDLALNHNHQPERENKHGKSSDNP